MHVEVGDHAATTNCLLHEVPRQLDRPRARDSSRGSANSISRASCASLRFSAPRPRSTASRDRQRVRRARPAAGSRNGRRRPCSRSRAPVQPLVVQREPSDRPPPPPRWTRRPARSPSPRSGRSPRRTAKRKGSARNAAAASNRIRFAQPVKPTLRQQRISAQLLSSLRTDGCSTKPPAHPARASRTAQAGDALSPQVMRWRFVAPNPLSTPTRPRRYKASPPFARMICTPKPFPTSAPLK